MKRVLLAAVAALSLSGCAALGLPGHVNDVITPARCAAAIKIAGTAESIANLLVAQGIEPNLATQVALAITEGRISLQAVCDALNPAVPLPAPGADPAPAPVANQVALETLVR